MKKLASIMALLIMQLSLAQVTTATIKGRVTDNENLALLGANVLAVHTPTGTKYGAAANEDGRFNLFNLRVGGPYTLTISYVGFQDNVISDIYLNLGQTQTFNMSLVSQSEMLDAVVINAKRL
jgi:hypothetical protein